MGCSPGLGEVARPRGLTAEAEILVGAVSAVVKAVTHPGPGHTQPVLALKLGGRAPSAPWKASGCGRGTAWERLQRFLGVFGGSSFTEQLCQVQLDVR